MLADSKISTLESGFKNFRICLRIRRMRVDDSRIRERKSCGFKNIRIRVDGALKIHLAIEMTQTNTLTHGKL